MSLTKMNTARLAEITSEVYAAMGLSEVTDEHTDELISRELAEAQIEIDEESEPDSDDCEYTRLAVRRALKAWNAEAIDPGAIAAEIPAGSEPSSE